MNAMPQSARVDAKRARPMSTVPKLALGAGWRVGKITPSRGLAGANGMRFGPDGQLYIASAFGSAVARVDVDGGAWTIVCGAADGIVSPDDLAFSGEVMYVAECMNARVSAWHGGHARVIADDLSGANGIDAFEGRLFVGQFLPEGKLWEIFPTGGSPRLLADGLPGPNGLCASPDGHVYFVQVFTGEVMRVPMDGGEVERVVGGLSAPSSVRLGSDGTIYAAQGGTGDVSMIDPRTGTLRTFAQSRPGIDNLAVDGTGRVFISYYIDGGVYELRETGEVRELLPAGLLGPYGIAVTETGVFIADGLAAAGLKSDGQLVPAGKFTDAGFPGYVRGLCRASASHLLTATSEGRVARYDPLAVTSELIRDGLAEPMGIDLRADGRAIVAETGSSRVISIDSVGSVEVVDDDFGRPVGVAVDRSGGIVVSDEERGTVELVGTPRETLLDGLDHPQDITVTSEGIFVVEAGARRLLQLSRDGGEALVVASNLPIGTDQGLRPTLNGLPEMIPGPISPFAGVAADSQGRLYLGGDAIGTIIILEPSINTDPGLERRGGRT
jgi:sugar lactone lactonase YvrE